VDRSSPSWLPLLIKARIEPKNRRSQDFSLDDALNSLAAFDPRKSQVVELRFFGGLSAEESAEVLKVSPDTVVRDWKLAKVWLLREMKKAVKSGSDK